MSHTTTHARTSHSGARQELTGAASEANFVPKLGPDGKMDTDALDVAEILGTKLRADDFQPANITAPAAVSTLNVSPQMLGRTPGGSTVLAGVTTDAPNNIVRLLDDQSDEILDATENKVYGRLTVSELSLTGTLTFTNGLTAVSGVGTAFTTEIEPGDLIQLDADGQYHEVNTITDDFNLDLVSGYGGTGGSGAGTRRRWVLTFYSNIAGVETAYSGFSGGETLQWFAMRVYTLFSLPVYPATRVLPSDQLVGEIPDATETLAGKVILATDGETTPGEVVQANDGRLFTLTLTAAAPAATDDSAAGFKEGDRWYDTGTGILYTLVDATPTAAVWDPLMLRVPGATAGNLAEFNAAGQVVDSGIAAGTVPAHASSHAQGGSDALEAADSGLILAKRVFN